MPRTATPHVHPTAIISDEAVLAEDVSVGPFAVIEGAVTVGPGCVIGPHAHLIGPLRIGANNQIGTGAVLGAAPQHLGYRGGDSRVEIGDGNVIREYATIHRAMPVGEGPGTGLTRIGSRCLLMGGSHVAHDCVIGDDVVLANYALIAGHASVGDRAFISGNSAVHQFCRIGRLAFISGTSAVGMDVPPFWVMQGINTVRGLNLVGMRRAGVLPEDRAAIRKAFHTIYATRPALTMPAALVRIEAELGALPVIRELLDFIRTSKRGVCGAHRFAAGADGDESNAA